MILTLRSKKHPVHKDDPRYLDAMKYFGQVKITPDWQNLYENILKRYNESMGGLTDLLNR